MRPVRLLVPANIQHNSGGNVYNARLVEGLRNLGVDVEVLPVDGSWPEAGATERRRLGALIGAWDPEQRPGAAVTIVDGLVAVGVPDELESAAKARQETWVLVHMPVPEESGADALDSEARALRAASGVICSSSWAADVLAARHGLGGLRVALPGTEQAPVAEGSVPPHLVTVAALLPNKEQLLVVEALAQLTELDWTASLVGSDQADPDYAARVRAAVAEHGLDNRLRITGELTGAPLEDEWNRADLSILVSRAEAFGMVVTESLAHGLPVVVREGTGAVEALSFAVPAGGGNARANEAERLPGTAVPLEGTDGPKNAALLAGVLRHWLLEAGTRTEWRKAALGTRTRLPGWEQTAKTVLDALAASRPGKHARG